jgi:hypothetical protein
MAKKTKVEPRSDFARELVALSEELRGRKDISNVELRLGRRSAAANFTHASALGLELPEGIQADYEAHDGVSLGWQERDTRKPGSDTRFVFGQLQLLPLMTGYFRAWAAPLGFSGEPDGSELAWLWELAGVLRGLDVPELDQVTRLVGFEQRSTRRAKQPVGPARLWFFDCKGPKYPLDLDYDGYRREALALVATAGWQAIFADLEQIPASQRRLLHVIVAQAEQALADVERLFAGRVRPDHVERVARLRASVG